MVREPGCPGIRDQTVVPHGWIGTQSFQLTYSNTPVTSHFAMTGFGCVVFFSRQVILKGRQLCRSCEFRHNHLALRDGGSDSVECAKLSAKAVTPGGWNDGVTVLIARKCNEVWQRLQAATATIRVVQPAYADAPLTRDSSDVTVDQEERKVLFAGRAFEHHSLCTLKRPRPVRDRPYRGVDGKVAAIVVQVEAVVQAAKCEECCAQRHAVRYRRRGEKEGRLLLKQLRTGPRA